jgi:hypothetical protein
MIDYRTAKMLGHQRNIQRYARLLATDLTELERQYLHKRIAEEQAELERLQESQPEQAGVVVAADAMGKRTASNLAPSERGRRIGCARKRFRGLADRRTPRPLVGFKGEHPPDEAFKTHGRPTNSPIVGPFPSRVAAETILPRRLDRFGRPTAPRMGS